MLSRSPPFASPCRCQPLFCALHPPRIIVPTRSSMKVSDLRGILQYVPRFRDRIFVIAIDGEIIGSPNFANILLDLAVLRSLSIKVVLVHGAGAQIRQLAAERAATISNDD